MVAFYALKNRPIYRLNIGKENYILMNSRKIRNANSAWITLDKDGANAKG